MRFKICRKASSSDDCERITGNPEVIGLSTGLVPRNAEGFRISRRTGTQRHGTKPELVPSERLPLSTVGSRLHKTCRDSRG